MKYDLSSQEYSLRCNNIASALQNAGIEAILLADNSNLYYTAGRVYSGYTYITAAGNVKLFVRRPTTMTGDNVIHIRKPENIAEELPKLGLELPKSLALEYDNLTYSDITRLKAVFPEAEIVNGSAVMRAVRGVKTEAEISLLRESALKHEHVYSHIPSLYQTGMTDFELQIEIERHIRQEGGLGQFRVAGQSMEIFMGSLIVGDNADNPTPYDFAMGGAGLSDSLPVGCNGTQIKNGNTVMVDMGGNFTGYMTDMTRTFYVGEIPEIATHAHSVSIKICQEIAKTATPGTACKSLYELAAEISKSEGVEKYFMGYSHKAGFVGHGVGIEINEMPVLAPRSRDVIALGNVIALEPKFVIPHVGAVGIENTYVARENGLERITNAPEELISLA